MKMIKNDNSLISPIVSKLNEEEKKDLIICLKLKKSCAGKMTIFEMEELINDLNLSIDSEAFDFLIKYVYEDYFKLYSLNDAFSELAVECFIDNSAQYMYFNRETFIDKISTREIREIYPDQMYSKLIQFLKDGKRFILEEDKEEFNKDIRQSVEDFFPDYNFDKTIMSQIYKSLLVGSQTLSKDKACKIISIPKIVDFKASDFKGSEDEE